MKKKITIIILLVLCIVAGLMLLFAINNQQQSSVAILNINEIGVIENYLAIEFPSTTKKVYSYYDSFDRYHLYVVVEFSEEDLDSYKQGRQWEAFAGLSDSEKSILTSPVMYRYKGLYLFKMKNLPWWKPVGNNTIWMRSKSEDDANGDEEYRTTELIEKDGDMIRVYIVKSSWVKAPQKIKNMFNDPRRVIKESELLPFTIVK